jgi:hypothetical protein
LHSLGARYIGNVAAFLGFSANNDDTSPNYSDFLPSGNPSGVRIAEITTRIVRLFEIPRKLLNDFLQVEKSEQVGIYFLIGQGENSAAPNVYIGQSGSVGARIVQHNQSKDFWDRVLVAVSLANSFTQTHGTFLEWHCLKEAKQTARYQLENGNAGSKPYTPAPLEADCLEIFDTMRVLIATLGHPVFEPVAKPQSQLSANELFFCTASGTDGRGEYTSEGFVVLKGSVGRRDSVPSIIGTTDERFRERLIQSGVMAVHEDKVIFSRNHLFRSPSTAAVALLGRTANGWETWKSADGRTLNQIIRQAVK